MRDLPRGPEVAPWVGQVAKFGPGTARGGRSLRETGLG
jgi:hypothetical protein